MYGVAEVRNVIQFHTVQNHNTMEIHKHLCAVYGGLMHCGPHYTQLFVYLRRTMVSYSVKPYYTSNLHSTVRLNRVGSMLGVLVSRDILYRLT